MKNKKTKKQKTKNKQKTRKHWLNRKGCTSGILDKSQAEKKTDLTP